MTFVSVNDDYCYYWVNYPLNYSIHTLVYISKCYSSFTKER